MKKFTLFLLMLLLGVVRNSSGQTKPYPILNNVDPRIQEILNSVDNFDSAIGKKFGQFSGVDISGRAVSKEIMLGKITLVNFWFEACPSCHLQFENLNRLVEKYRADSNFQVIGITFDAIEKAKLNALKNGIHYNVISVPRDKCTSLNFGKGYPCNFIIEQSGKIVFGHIGSDKLGKDSFTEIISPYIDSLLAIEIQVP